MADQIFKLQDHMNPEVKLSDWFLNKNWKLIDEDGDNLHLSHSEIFECSRGVYCGEIFIELILNKETGKYKILSHVIEEKSLLGS